MTKKKTNWSLTIQLFLLLMLIISGFVALATPDGIKVLNFTCMWFIAMIQTLGLIIDASQSRERGEEDLGEIEDEEEF